MDNNSKVHKACEECDGEGWIEIYPPHGANAYDGAGNVVYQWIPCPVCSIEVLEVKRQERLHLGFQ